MPLIGRMGSMNQKSFGKFGNNSSGFPNSFSFVVTYNSKGTGSNGSVQTFTPSVDGVYQFVATGATASKINETSR